MHRLKSVLEPLVVESPRSLKCLLAVVAQLAAIAGVLKFVAVLAVVAELVLAVEPMEVVAGTGPADTVTEESVEAAVETVAVAAAAVVARMTAVAKAVV